MPKQKKKTRKLKEHPGKIKALAKLKGDVGDIDDGSVPHPTNVNKKVVEYQAFINWSALPLQDRKAIGLPDANDFGHKYDVNRATLSSWKKRPDFFPAVQKLTKSWLKNLTPTVMRALFDKAIQKGFDNPKYLEMWLQYVEDFNPKQEVLIKQQQEFTRNNLNTLISYLPTEEQKEFYEVFNRLIDQAERAFQSNTGEEISEEELNSDTLELPSTSDLVHESNSSGNKMAKEATSDIRRDLEGESKQDII